MRCNNRGLFLSVIALAFGLSMSVTVRAQSTATLQGTVTDTKGAVVPNATVTALNKGTRIQDAGSEPGANRGCQNGYSELSNGYWRHLGNSACFFRGFGYRNSYH